MADGATEEYEPTTDEVLEYARWLGIQKNEENDLLWIAREGLTAPLPENWKPCRDENSEIYYFNFATGESEWDHPCDAIFRDKVKIEREKLKRVANMKQPSLLQKDTGRLEPLGSSAGLGLSKSSSSLKSFSTHPVDDDQDNAEAMEDLQLQVMELEHTLANERAVSKDYQQQLRAAEQDLMKMQDRLDQLGGDSGCDKAAALSKAEDRVAELEVKLQQKQAALDANKARLWKAQEDKNSLQTKLKEAEEVAGKMIGLDQAESASEHELVALRATNAQLAADLEQTDKARQVAVEEKVSLEEAAAQLRDEAASVSDKLAHALKCKEALMESEASLTEQVSHLTTQVDEANEVHVQECREYDARIDKLSQEIVTLQDQANQGDALPNPHSGGLKSVALLEQEVEARGERIAALEESQKHLEAQIRDLGTELAAKERDLSLAQSQVQSLEQVEGSNRESLKNATRDLEMANKRVEEFIQVNAKLEDDMCQIKQAQQAQPHHNASEQVELELERARHEVVTWQRQLAETEAALEAARKDQVQSALKISASQSVEGSLKIQLNEMQEELDGARRQLVAAGERREVSERQLAEARRALAAREEAFDETEESMRATLRTAKEAAQVAERSLIASEARLRQAEQELWEAVQARQRAEDKLNIEATSQKQVEIAAGRAQEGRKRMEEELMAEQQEREQQYERRLKSAQDAHKAALRRLDLEIQELKDANSQLENDLIRAKQEAKKARDASLQLTQELEAVRDVHKALAEAKTRAEAKCMDLCKASAVAGEEAKRATEAERESQEAARLAIMQRSQVEADLAALRERVTEAETSRLHAEEAGRQAVNEHARTKAQLKSVMEEVARMQKELEESAAAAVEANSARLALAAARGRAEAAEAASEQDRASWRQELAAARTAASTAQASCQAAEGRERAQAELARLAQSQVAELQVMLQSMQEKNRTLEVRAAEAERSKEDAERVAQGKHLALTVLHGEMDASQAEVVVLRAKLAAAAGQGVEGASGSAGVMTDEAVQQQVAEEVQLRAKVADLQRQVEEKQRKLVRAQRESEALEERHLEQLSAARADRLKDQFESQQATVELKQLREKVHVQSEANAELHQEIARLRSSLRTAFEDVEDHKSQANFEARARESHAKLAQEQLDGARQRASAALAEKHAEMAAQQTALKEELSRVQDMLKAQQKVAQQHADIFCDNARLEQELSQVKVELSKTRAVALEELQQSKAAAASEITLLKSECSRFRQELERAEATIHPDVKELRESVAALQARLQESTMERISMENAHKMALVEADLAKKEALYTASAEHMDLQMKLQNEEHKVLHLQRALAAKQAQLLEMHRQHQVEEQQHKVVSLERQLASEKQKAWSLSISDNIVPEMEYVAGMQNRVRPVDLARPPCESQSVPVSDSGHPRQPVRAWEGQGEGELVIRASTHPALKEREALGTRQVGRHMISATPDRAAAQAGSAARKPTDGNGLKVPNQYLPCAAEFEFAKEPGMHHHSHDNPPRLHQQEIASDTGQVNKSLHYLLRDAVVKDGTSPASAANEIPLSALESDTVVNHRQVMPLRPLTASVDSIQFIPERSNFDESHSPKWSPMRYKPHGFVPAGPVQRQDHSLYSIIVRANEELSYVEAGLVYLGKQKHSLKQIQTELEQAKREWSTQMRALRASQASAPDNPDVMQRENALAEVKRQLDNQVGQLNEDVMALRTNKQKVTLRQHHLQVFIKFLQSQDATAAARLLDKGGGMLQPEGGWLAGPLSAPGASPECMFHMLLSAIQDTSTHRSQHLQAHMLPNPFTNTSLEHGALETARYSQSRMGLGVHELASYSSNKAGHPESVSSSTMSLGSLAAASTPDKSGISRSGSRRRRSRATKLRSGGCDDLGVRS